MQTWLVCGWMRTRNASRVTVSPTRHGEAGDSAVLASPIISVPVEFFLFIFSSVYLFILGSRQALSTVGQLSKSVCSSRQFYGLKACDVCELNT